MGIASLLMQDLWFSQTLFTVLCETKGHSVHFVYMYIIQCGHNIFILCSVYLGVYYSKQHIQYCMDEGTLKTPIPECRLYWSFLFGVAKHFCRFWIWSETECKTPAEYGPKYISTPPSPPPPPHSHTLSVYNILYTGKGGRGEEVREKVQ